MTAGMARVIVGRYRLLRPLGRGGMGVVWQAHDTLLGRDVAIKEIWLPSAGNEPVDPADPLIRRALREAQASARLRHPSIVTVHDVVTDEGRPWIVMELINGRSLAQAIQEHGLLTEQRTAEIGQHVLEALRAAHRAGIAHRDVKPANILLDTDRVVLTDFGIAAIDDGTALTATGQMVGSPAYLAPERINGQPATAAADLWALGVTLYTAVTGRSPFQRDDTQATFAAILTSQPNPPAHAGRLWPVIKGLLVKDPARRLTTEQARKLLANVAHPTGSPETAAPEPGRRWPGRWPSGPRRRRSSLDDMPATLAAAPPTLASPTAEQDHPEERGLGVGPPSLRQAIPAPIAAKPQPPGAAPHEPAATIARTAATRPDDTVPAADARTTVVAGPTGPTEPDFVDSDVDPHADADVDPHADADADTTAADADATAAESASVVTAADTIAPLAPHPAAVLGPRTNRAKAVWFAALAAALVFLAGGILWIAGPGRGDGRRTDRESIAAPSGGSLALAAQGSVKPSASPSSSANPSLDSCLVGTWQMTSLQLVNHFDGVDARFTSSGGTTMRIWPDGNTTEDFNSSPPLTAIIKGASYAEVIRGAETSHTETRDGRVYSSEFSGGRTFEVTRNGRRVQGGAMITPPDDLPYICTETRLTIYGNAKVSTQSYQRISDTP